MHLVLFLMLAAPDRADALIAEIARSGRVLDLSEDTVAPPPRLAPGPPPLLAFRYFSGAEKHRFGNLDVMLDDAGH
jgi:hypothetical protein